MSFAASLVVRPGRAEDLAYVLDTWLRSYHDSPEGGRIPLDVYRSAYGHQGLVKRMLATSPVTVIHAPDGADYVIGWSCGRSGLLHYVHVRREFRRRGVARRLVSLIEDGETLIYTHRTPEGLELVGPDATFVNPHRNPEIAEGE